MVVRLGRAVVAVVHCSKSEITVKPAKPQLSVVVPIYNEKPHLLASLKHFQRLRQNGAELILVDGYSNDESHQILMEHSDLWDRCLVSGPGRARQMNAGASIANSDTLFFVHIDSRFDSLPDLSALVESIAHSRWGFCRLRLSKNNFLYRWLGRFIHWRSLIGGGVTGDQGVCVEKLLFQKIGAYPAIPLMEDVVLSDKLRKLNRGTVLPCAIETSSRRWEKNGLLKTIVAMWWVRIQFRMGVSAHDLAKKYYPQIDFSSQMHRQTTDLESYLKHSETL